MSLHNKEPLRLERVILSKQRHERHKAKNKLILLKMTNIDVKIRLVLRLNAKLKKTELYLNNSVNVPKMFQNDVNKAIKNHFILQSVLKNLNYLNY